MAVGASECELEGFVGEGVGVDGGALSLASVVHVLGRTLPETDGERRRGEGRVRGGAHQNGRGFWRQGRG